MRFVKTQDAPTPAGHYSQAVVHGGFVFVAGQLPIDPDRRTRDVGTIEEQTECVLRNVESILRAAGSGLDRVVQMTIYVSDISLWGQVDEVYTRVMRDHRPARAVVPTRDLHYGYQIEMQAIAAAGEGEK